MLELNCFGDVYRGRRVLVTGHTGFKGSWLSLWLRALGAHVIGVALPPPTEPSHWNLLQLPITDRRADIRDEAAVRDIFDAEKPEIVFHLAAQPLVRRSYTDPVTTWSTNVMGTTHVLEAVRNTPGVRAAVVVTSDKCYENREWLWPYRENDRLGGHDPYSASKACSELVVSSYRSAFLRDPGAPLLATARGGNVIGGADWSEDRLIPDLVRAMRAQTVLTIRSPGATRPWQHVLDCLSGYLLLGQRLMTGEARFADAWNFGPDEQGNHTVEYVLQVLSNTWPQLRWNLDSGMQPHEAALLQLDSAKSRTLLGWRPTWNFESAIRETASWYKNWLESGEISSSEQLASYVNAAADDNVAWARS